MIKKQYDPNKHYRSSAYHTTCYTMLSNRKVVLSVSPIGLETLVNKKLDGDGKEFSTIEEARQFCLSKGYIVEYDPKEELKKALDYQNSLNKNTEPIVQ